MYIIPRKSISADVGLLSHARAHYADVCRALLKLVECGECGGSGGETAGPSMMSNEALQAGACWEKVQCPACHGTGAVDTAKRLEVAEHKLKLVTEHLNSGEVVLSQATERAEKAEKELSDLKEKAGALCDKLHEMEFKGVKGLPSWMNKAVAEISGEWSEPLKELEDASK